MVIPAILSTCVSSYKLLSEHTEKTVAVQVADLYMSHAAFVSAIVNVPLLTTEQSDHMLQLHLHSFLPLGRYK
jgi:hypothetical protein